MKAASSIRLWDVLNFDHKTLEHVFLAYDVPPNKLEMEFNNVYDINMCIFLLSLVTKRFKDCLRFPLLTVLKFRITVIKADDDAFLVFNYCSSLICQKMGSAYNNGRSILRYMVHDEISCRKRDYVHC